MPDKQTEIQRRLEEIQPPCWWTDLVEKASHAYDHATEDELEQFHDEYWLKRGVNPRNIYERHTVLELLTLKEIDNG